MQICDYSECTGCSACMNICPRGAVSLVLDDVGKTIPMIDEEKCVQCGVCLNTCPVLHPVATNKPEKVFAAWSCNEKDVELSSSGGVATVLARYVISQSGVVFGVSSEDAEVKHITIHNYDDLERIRGSKYVQSEIGFAYQEVKKYLKNGKYVMFIGTPCQVAGLKKYLNEDYEKLYTVDLICHGNPPQTYLKEHNATVLKNKEWNKVTFRGKYNYVHTLYAHSQIVYQRKSSRDNYFAAFLAGLTYRENCYSCNYACPERCSDITVADFWGINRKTLMHPYDGRISLVLVNSKRGNSLFEEIKEQLICEERTLDEAMHPSQTNIHHPSIPHKDRDVFIKEYRKKGFEKAVQSTDVGKKVRANRVNGLLRENRLANVLRKTKNAILNRTKKSR